MKLKSSTPDPDFPNPTTKLMYQSGLTTYIQPRLPRDLSYDHKLRRVSPLPSDRYSHLPPHHHHPTDRSHHHPLHPNDYQLPPRPIETFPSDTVRAIQEMQARLDRLEGRV